MTGSTHEEISTVSPASSYPTTADDDSVFRTPSMSLRGRKRKSTYDDTSYDYSLNMPKRGRPKGVGAARTKTTPLERKPRAGGLHKDAHSREPDPSGLFAALKTGRNINDIVEKWIVSYENAPDQAIIQILQLMITCCGCSGHIDSNMVHNMEFKNIIAKLTEEFDEDSGNDYPLVLAGPQWKKFRQNIGDFLRLFVVKCKSGIIFDVSLMDSLIQLLTGLADSQLRAFRHTATFAAMKLSSAIVEVVVDLARLKEKNAIQVETEKAKLRQMGTSERLELLLATKDDLDHKIDELSSMIQYMFKSVFVHRYRDVVPDVRCICIGELGNWMQSHPAYFLEDSYLKYIGWSLFDKFADVRLKCISSLLALYSHDALVSRLELFTNKFKDRLVSMVMDVDTDVAIKSCQLMTHIYRAFPNLLELKDCGPIYEVVYCNNRALAIAAGEFLNARVFAATDFSQHYGDPNQINQLTAQESRQLITDLVTFYIEGAVHNHAAFLVDALIDTSPMLKDWQNQVDMLLSGEADRFDTELVEVMCCAVRQAATGENPVGRTNPKRGPVPAMKDTKALQDERIRISEIFIPSLPRLLAQFIADQSKVLNLTTLPLYFQLEMYPNARFGRHLEELMMMLDRIVEQHSDDEILRNVAKIVQYFSENIAVAQQTEPARLRLVDGVALQLRQGMQRFVEEEEERLDEEDEAALLASYRKMTAFASFMDIRRWDVWDMTVNLLNNSHKFQSADLVEKGVNWLLQSLVCDLKNVTDGNYNEDFIRRLKKRRDQFLVCTQDILREGASGVEHTYLCLCDVLVFFNWKLAADAAQNDLMQSLPVKLDPEFSQRINSFVVDNVFVSQEEESFINMDDHTQINLMYKRRNLLGQYCKLIMHGVLPVTDAALVLRYYTKFYNDFGDILKHLLQKCKEMDKVSAAKAAILSLINSYEELKTLSPDHYVDPNSDDFTGLRELARRFALSFGPDSVKNRDAIAMIHKDGITHALDLEEIRRNRRKNTKPQSVSFLEVLVEFSPRLVRQDKMAVLHYLEKHCPVDPIQLADDPFWGPYLIYKNSLTIVKNA
ncbi:STAG domain-containing protein [Ditylenchus destructor]|uniref:STAG domain-containing protein n=1 Tax=Ditylenchus destructor TaxID=166010 RepID=A0AAD4RBL1_9BILA|nr:STAG domain-containing protein [Ditylenchus destructor]